MEIVHAKDFPELNVLQENIVSCLKKSVERGLTPLSASYLVTQVSGYALGSLVRFGVGKEKSIRDAAMENFELGWNNGLAGLNQD